MSPRLLVELATGLGLDVKQDTDGALCITGTDAGRPLVERSRMFAVSRGLGAWSYAGRGWAEEGLFWSCTMDHHGLVSAAKVTALLAWAAGTGELPKPLSLL